MLVYNHMNILESMCAGISWFVTLGFECDIVIMIHAQDESTALNMSLQLIISLLISKHGGVGFE